MEAVFIKFVEKLNVLSMCLFWKTVAKLDSVFIFRSMMQSFSAIVTLLMAMFGEYLTNSNFIWHHMCHTH